MNSRNNLKRTKIQTYLISHKYQLASFLIILGFLGSFIYGYLEQYSLYDPNWEYPENAQELTVENAAEWASDWFIRSVRSDGSYRYIYYLDKDTYSTTYNYLRHWGSAYSMIYYYEYNPYPELLQTVRSTIDWGLKYFTTIENDSNIGYFFYQYSSSSGGPALALMAMTKYRELTNDPRYDTYIAKLANFLLWMQQPSGKIRSMYITNGVPGGEDNPFYPSESLLGLTLVYKLTGEAKYLTALEKAYNYYRNRDNFDYLAGENTPFIPWSTSAFSELYLLTGNYSYADFAFEMIDHRLKSQVINTNNYDQFGHSLLGCISRSVAVSSTLEGLGDCYAAAVKANDSQRMGDYEYRMRIGIEWILTLQMRYAECEAMNLTHPERAFGGFRHSFEYEDNMTMRNDYTQHSISAITKYLKYFPVEVVNSTEFRIPISPNSSDNIDE